jgi:uncharacterized protein YjbI with pentapeptide repeats
MPKVLSLLVVGFAAFAVSYVALKASRNRDIRRLLLRPGAIAFVVAVCASVAFFVGATAASRLSALWVSLQPVWNTSAASSGSTGITPPVVTLVGSFVTASVALVAAMTTAIAGILTFAVTQHSTRRSQRDGQFYDALTRFGDQDSASRRAGGAVQLAQMAAQYETYRPITIEQLCSGSLLEGDPVVVASIANAFQVLASTVPHELTARLTATNMQLQGSFASRLASYCAAHDAQTPETWDPHLSHAATLARIARSPSGDQTIATAFDALVLRTLIGRTPSFANLVGAAHQQLTALGTEEQNAGKAAAGVALQVDASRLRGNVEALAATLPVKDSAAEDWPARLARSIWKLRWYRLARTILRLRALRGPRHGVDLNGVFLCGARLPRTDLRRARLAGAQLQGCDLSDSDLSRVDAPKASFQYAMLSFADLARANCSESRFDSAELAYAALGTAGLDGATFDGADWWTANFDDPTTRVIDKSPVLCAAAGGRTATKTVAAIAGKLSATLSAVPSSPPPHPSLNAVFQSALKIDSD